MTDLTEQWKKGELPEGLYWVKHDGVINILDDLEISLTNVEQILGEVPDYVEWQNMVNCACEEHEANKRLIEENDNLKDLLNEWVQFETEENPNDYTVMSDLMKELSQKTKEVLKCH